MGASAFIRMRAEQEARLKAQQGLEEEDEVEGGEDAGSDGGEEQPLEVSPEREGLAQEALALGVQFKGKTMAISVLRKWSDKRLSEAIEARKAEIAGEDQ